jgi:hypothetical protein
MVYKSFVVVVAEAPPPSTLIIIIMDLTSADYNQLNQSTAFLSIGKRLAQVIVKPPESKHVFDLLMSDKRASFPALVAAFAQSKTPLHRRSKDARALLMEALRQDMQANRAAVAAQLNGEKRLDNDANDDEPLPSDPTACIERLDQMDEALRVQIDAAHSRLGTILRARRYVERVLDQQRALEAYDADDADFAATPQESPLPPLNHHLKQKKPRCA